MTNFDVKKIRLTMLLSQNQFADKIGIAQGTLAKIEGNTLKLEKYESKIRVFVEQWKTEKIKSLTDEITFILSL
jgi:DNA-binding XRE family transcriptional regulator